MIDFYLRSCDIDAAEASELFKRNKIKSTKEVVQLVPFKISGQKSSQKKMVMDAMFMSFRLQMVQMPGRWTQDNISVKAYSKVTVLYTFFVVACWQAALASVLTLPRFVF